eukprot:15365487-Ditylum_brightwellii.AAC.1
MNAIAGAQQIYQVRENQMDVLGCKYLYEIGWKKEIVKEQKEGESKFTKLKAIDLEAELEKQ